MRQKVLTFSTGFAAALACLAGGSMFGHPAAQAETFATRWTAVEAVQKGDRLSAPARAKKSSVVFYSDPKAAVTVATKIELAQNETARKVREVPNENARQDKKKKLPVGCEPSFSPVTTPSMANVTGRCLAAHEGTTLVAGLAR